LNPPSEVSIAGGCQGSGQTSGTLGHCRWFEGAGADALATDDQRKVAIPSTNLVFGETGRFAGAPPRRRCGGSRRGKIGGLGEASCHVVVVAVV
jgi:uncharacterized protein YodC (DUF2158 family)